MKLYATQIYKFKRFRERNKIQQYIVVFLHCYVNFFLSVQWFYGIFIEYQTVKEPVHTRIFLFQAEGMELQSMTKYF